MTENILGKPLNETLRHRAQEMGIKITETCAPAKAGAAPIKDGVWHIIAVRKDEWVAARFTVGLPQKERAL